jgi:hypothetical protein
MQRRPSVLVGGRGIGTLLEQQPRHRLVTSL